MRSAGAAFAIRVVAAAAACRDARPTPDRVELAAPARHGVSVTLALMPS
jgi:hypothetical protein